MNPQGLSGITFQQIEIFLCAAKHENFTKVAEELFMTQASVSRNIQNIEIALGIVLFVRHKQRVHLTNAGRCLYQSWKLILRQAEKAAADALQQQENQFHALRIGDMSCTYLEHYLLPIAREFEYRFPHTELNLDRVDNRSLLSNIHDRQYDAAFCINLGLTEQFSYAFDVIPLFSMDPCIVISDTNPLYSHQTFDLKDLEEQTLLTMRGGPFQYYQKFALSVCQEMQIPIRKTRYVSNVFSIAMELKREKCFAVMDQCFAPNGNDRLRFIPLNESKTKSGIALIIPKDNSNPHLHEFVSVCKDVTSKYHTHSV